MLQSHRGYIEIFPALPAEWKDCRFEKLRAQGAFLVSAQQKDGALQSVTITSEKGTTLKLMNPFAGSFVLNGKTVKAAKGEIITLPTKPKTKFVFMAM
jgi:alpha-L-fucosidase 2